MRNSLFDLSIAAETQHAAKRKSDVACVQATGALTACQWPAFVAWRKRKRKQAAASERWRSGGRAAPGRMQPHDASHESSWWFVFGRQDARRRDFLSESL